MMRPCIAAGSVWSRHGADWQEGARDQKGRRINDQDQKMRRINDQDRERDSKPRVVMWPQSWDAQEKPWALLGYSTTTPGSMSTETTTTTKSGALTNHKCDILFCNMYSERIAAKMCFLLRAVKADNSQKEDIKVKSGKFGKRQINESFHFGQRAPSAASAWSVCVCGLKRAQLGRPDAPLWYETRCLATWKRGWWGWCGGGLLGGFAFLASAASCLLLIFLFRTICVLTPIGADRPGQEIPWLLLTLLETTWTRIHSGLHSIALQLRAWPYCVLNTWAICVTGQQLKSKPFADKGRRDKRAKLREIIGHNLSTDFLLWSLICEVRMIQRWNNLHFSKFYQEKIENVWMGGWVEGSHYRTIIPPFEFCNVMSSLGICMHVFMKYFQMRNYFCFETKNLHVFRSLNWASLTRWQYLLLPCIICFITLWGPSESGNVHISNMSQQKWTPRTKMNTEDKNEHREQKWAPRMKMNTEDENEPKN